MLSAIQSAAQLTDEKGGDYVCPLTAHQLPSFDLQHNDQAVPTTIDQAVASDSESEAALGTGKIGQSVISPDGGPTGVEVEVNVEEVPLEVRRTLKSWDRTLASTDRKVLPLQFLRAAIESLRLASASVEPKLHQQIVDALHAMGKRHGLANDAVLNFIESAAIAPLDHRPGDAPPAMVSSETGDTQRQPLKLTFFDKCGDFANKKWILKGIVALGETSSWIAPPGPGKSALLTEIAVHCAAKIDWRGHRVKTSCGVVVLALERGDLFKRRLSVYRQRDGLTGLPIAVADAVVDLLDPHCVEIIVSTVRAAERQFGCAVGLIIFDTYAKAIAASGGDEDKARDQNRAAANLRRVHACLNVHIALVGHTGKDESRGARGSSAHAGDVDVMVQISGKTTKVAKVVKGNDQPEREVARFALEAFELGRDEDGDPITTAIVSSEAPGEPIRTSTVNNRKKKTKADAALRVLLGCIADSKTPRPVDDQIPADASVVTMGVWRSQLEAHSIINPKGSWREEFKRIHVTLKESGFIGIWGDFVWPSQDVTTRHSAAL
ncbi:AAA family ATPase [Bradyrhizobium sp. WSM1253]|uniref:AAA family ATPase n=1 Tax=Bradyrhizobium sp. WSM1253 TaxID=319003 RepID=UPI00025D2E0C|nr:AAA family ATPase [Bradyrhizobium sp. WSM1253]EIG63506.1 hypothetical protein Bra1253DRAFT_08484 [Bradyrhizobium sp. WSM1253]